MMLMTLIMTMMMTMMMMMMMMMMTMMMMMMMMMMLMFLYSDQETLQLSKWPWRLHLVSTKHSPFSFFKS